MNQISSLVYSLSGRIGVHFLAIYQPSFPPKTLLKPFSKTLFPALKDILCLIPHPFFGPSHLESLCTTYSLMQRSHESPQHPQHKHTEGSMVRVTLRSSAHYRTAESSSCQVTKPQQLSQLYYPPSPSPLAPLPLPPPSVILSNPLSFFKFYLFPSFFIRGHHSIQLAVCDPVVSKGTLGAVPAMLDRLMLIHTSQHYDKQSIILVHDVLQLFRDSFCIF